MNYRKEKKRQEAIGKNHQKNKEVCGGILIFKMKIEEKRLLLEIIRKTNNK